MRLVSSMRILAVAVLLIAAACDAGPASRIGKPPTRPYCESNDCSSFPKGYHSLELHGEWVYIPAKEYLRASVTEEVLLSLVQGDRSKLDGLLPELRFGSQSGYVYPANFGWEVSQRIHREGQVVPGAVDPSLYTCCEGLGAFYGLRTLQEVSGRLSTLSISEPRRIEPFEPNSLTFLPVKDVPEEWLGVAERFLIDFNRNDTASWSNVSLVSKEPLIQGSKVYLNCHGDNCDFRWGTGQRAPFANGQFLIVRFGSCRRGGADCSTRASIDDHFSRIERFLAEFDEMLEIMKQRPEGSR